ncbi:putative cysteine ABC transporter CydDC [Moraxella catarrhalis 12P80B1]|nr:hypothetical protein [Moraxella catarrhalis]EGE15470.1 putative cysteine ABC transporter CydDC [Moraxella catarrhalis 12P80B1]
MTTTQARLKKPKKPRRSQADIVANNFLNSVFRPAKKAADFSMAVRCH